MKKTALLLMALLVILILAGCATSPTVKTIEVEKTVEVVATRTPQPTAAPTQAAFPTATQAGAVTPQPQATPTPRVEERVVELEWPLDMQLGESDLVRLALIPSEDGYTVQAEFPEHAVESQPVPVEWQAGYTLAAVARLDGVGFEIEPGDDRLIYLPPGETVVWRWTLRPRSSGQQRLSIQLLLRWEPQAPSAGEPREALAFSRGLEIRVDSFLGMSRDQALATGFIGLLAGTGLALGAVLFRPRTRLPALRQATPNTALVIEPAAGIQLAASERTLISALFNRYARLGLEREFLSGYSGARTFLAQPVRRDGRADAATIIKLGPQSDIRREYANYEAYVKDSLPPITARIQHAPVSAPGSSRAAIQYTFIAEPGRLPTSLRLALLENPDPGLLFRLFDTFGPNWWMQRRPYTFRLAQEYDRLLPAHLVLQPVEESTRPVVTLEEKTLPARAANLPTGALVRVKAFRQMEIRADGQSLSLAGIPQPGYPPLRLRWMSLRSPAGTLARVIQTRAGMLREACSGFDLLGLPDPLAHLPGWLEERTASTQSIIHGDLNLENVLTGPGGFVWLIDFAQTREGPPLFDFAHLNAEIIGHILAAQINDPVEYLRVLRSGEHPLLSAMQSIAARCLFNPNQPGEYRLALALACLGALKYPNLDAHSKHLLYLTAGYLVG